MSDSASEKQRVSKQAEQVLKDSERLFRAVWEYAFDAMALSTPDGTVFAANPAYFHLYGFPPEEVIGKNFSNIAPQKQRQWAQELYDHFFQSPTICPSFVDPIRRADGTERFVESRYHFMTHQGQRIAMLSVIRDITEEKRGEEASWVSEEMLGIALEVGHMDTWDAYAPLHLRHSILCAVSQGARSRSHLQAAPARAHRLALPVLLKQPRSAPVAVDERALADG